MSMRIGIRGGLLAGICTMAVLAFGSLPAQGADFIAPNNDPPTAADGWQAGTCTTDTPECTPDTPAQFFTQAAGHPGAGITQFTVIDNGGIPPLPIESIKDVRVDLPAGLSVNANAVPQCPQATFAANPLGCAGSEVGTSYVTAAGVTLPFPVYNLEPPSGVPLLVGFNPVVAPPVLIVGGVAWDSDYHEFFTISEISNALPITRNRLVFNGNAGFGTGGGAFITNPSTCYDPDAAGFEHIYSTFLRADSYQSPDPDFPANPPSSREAILPPGVKPTGCGDVPFDPSIDVAPGTAQTDSPAGGSVDVKVPFDPSDTIANSNVQQARVTLPQGVGLNPSSANGLQACTDAQFGKGTRNPVACPVASRIGSVSIHTPVLPGDAPQLSGDVYVGQPLSNDPTSGNQFRIFVDGESARYGLSIRLVGNVSANPHTGQLSARFDNLPQNPFDSFKVTFDGGPKATLTSPPICGPHQTTTALTPYSGTGDATPSSSFTLTSAPGGGDCAKTLAQRPFAPGYATATTVKTGGAFTNLTVNISRSDGNQELKGVDVILPRGLVAKLAGVTECPNASLAAAAAKSGAAERQAPSCPPNSEVGSVDIQAGSGSQPLPIGGKVYLAGPYKGAPLSLAFITPAVAGPYDLGTVVVRVALFLDPDTATVRAISDPIPHVFGGVVLDLRSISVHVNRKGFTVNPTSCLAMAFYSTLYGGGGDPNNPAAFQSTTPSTPFQAVNCNKLGFRPRLFLRLFGNRKDLRRSGHPRLRAVLIPRRGDANLKRTAVTLPKSLQLDQSHIGTICTRARFAANNCPKASIYGHAKAFSPLLDKMVRGPVYLRSSDNPLPDLVARMRGQVEIHLVGRIDTNKRGMMRTTFVPTPDVPVTKFILTMAKGKRSLLVPNRNLCGKHRGKATANLRAHNTKKFRSKVKLRTPCRKHHKKHR